MCNQNPQSEEVQAVIRVEQHGNRLVFAGNTEGFDKLADMFGGTRAYAEMFRDGHGKGMFVCVLPPCEAKDIGAVAMTGPAIDQAITEMVDCYTIQFESDILAEYGMASQDAVAVAGAGPNR